MVPRRGRCHLAVSNVQVYVNGSIPEASTLAVMPASWMTDAKLDTADLAQ